MVSFQCDGCADTVKKPKLDSHRQRCHAPFTCLDCSTTFHGQEYKGHTSCITEAQKYQGALYKEPKKGKGSEPQVNGSAPAPPTPVAESSTSAAASSIHPSRLQAIESGPSPQQANGYVYSRGGRGGRGGFAARGGGRGGFGGASTRIGATGENRLTPGNGMRSWGSTPVNGSPAPEAATPEVASTNTTAAAAAVNDTPVAEDGEKKKKKKKKGDKGGTGSKANSKRPKSEAGDEATTVITTPAEEPSNKKRKRDPSPASAAPAPSQETHQPSDKTLKRLRKNLTKLDGDGMTLAAWLEKVGKGKKDETIHREHVLKGLKVGRVDGKWILEVPA